MLWLGVHGGFKRAHELNLQGFSMHDAAAVLVRDRAIVAAIEEERLTRMKHSNCFPEEAIARCLAIGGVGLGDVDRIAVHGEETGFGMQAAMDFKMYPDIPLLDGRGFVSGLFERSFGVRVDEKLSFTNHHVAHAWSAIVPAGFPSALVLCLDGDGDGKSGVVYRYAEGALTPLADFPPEDSLGHFYTGLLALVGYGRFDEYKVMGLAPYGNPSVHAAVFDRLWEPLPEGRYRLAPDTVMLGTLFEAGLVQAARRKGEPFTQAHKDVAAAIQRTFEKIALHIAQGFARATGERRLCFAGGIAHNCTLNGHLLYGGDFDEVYVQPAAHDAGGAFGAVFAEARARDPAWRPTGRPHLLLGPAVPDAADVEARLAAWSELVTFARSPRVVEETAARLAEGEVVGWVQGRSEFGPRALGNRSILADPRPAANKDRINAMVKKREGYRPFAPAVLEERVWDFFERPHAQADLSSMIFVVRVAAEQRSTLGAVTHVDGTARVQTVSRETNPAFWALIDAFGARTGVPILLNTSFNNHAEPIVDSVDDAVACFLTTDIQALVIGDFIVTKRDAPARARALASLVPSIPPGYALLDRVERTPAGEERTVRGLVSTVSRFFRAPFVELSPATFGLLGAADGTRTIAQLAAAASVPPPLDELERLWTARAVALRPVAARR